jgi:hypothetical protein
MASKEKFISCIEILKIGILYSGTGVLYLMSFENFVVPIL